MRFRQWDILWKHLFLKKLGMYKKNCNDCYDKDDLINVLYDVIKMSVVCGEENKEVTSEVIFRFWVKSIQCGTTQLHNQYATLLPLFPDLVYIRCHVFNVFLVKSTNNCSIDLHYCLVSSSYNSY